VLVVGTLFTVTNHEPSMCPQTRTTPSFFERILPSRPNSAAGKLSSRNPAFSAYRPPCRHFAAHNSPAASGILQKFFFYINYLQRNDQQKNFEPAVISH